MKMLCTHHIIQYQYIHASDDFYSWLFALEHAGNRSTKRYLGTYLSYFTFCDMARKLVCELFRCSVSDVVFILFVVTMP